MKPKKFTQNQRIERLEKSVANMYVMIQMLYDQLKKSKEK